MFNPAPSTLDPSPVPSSIKLHCTIPSSPQGFEVSCWDVVATSRDVCEGSIYCNLACHEHIMYCHSREQKTNTPKRIQFSSSLCALTSKTIHYRKNQ